MSEAELRMHRCCFTGHRPDKMILGEKEIKPMLEKAIDEAIEDGYVTFITGMAMGVDIWAAEIVLERKKKNDNLHLICALPHPGFETRRSLSEKMKFNKIIKKASLLFTALLSLSVGTSYSVNNVTEVEAAGATYTKVTEAMLNNTPEDLILDRIMYTMDTYTFATRQNEL